MTRGPDVFNIGEAAAFLGAHEQTVRRLARRGAIPAFKVGKDWRFRKDAVLHWAENQQACRAPGLVLIVDDDEGICRALTRVVNGIGHTAQSTTDAQSGLAIVARNPPDLVLLDLMMAGMNGAQFLKELRATQPSLPVVIVTAYPDSELMAEAMKHGTLLLLPKPFEATQVERIVRLVVGAQLATSPRTEPEAVTP